MGLFNLLVHWFYETADVEWSSANLGYSEFNTTTMVYEFTKIDEFKDRLLSKDKEGTKLKYTGLSLRHYSLIFFIGIILHYVLMTLMITVKKKIKTGVIKDKREKEETSLPSFRGKYMSYVFSSIAFPEISEDWDEDDNYARGVNSDATEEDAIILVGTIKV